MESPFPKSPRGWGTVALVSLFVVLAAPSGYFIGIADERRAEEWSFGMEILTPFLAAVAYPKLWFGWALIAWAACIPGLALATRVQPNWAWDLIGISTIFGGWMVTGIGALVGYVMGRLIRPKAVTAVVAEHRGQR